MMGTALTGKWTATPANVQHETASQPSSTQNTHTPEAEIVQPFEASGQK